MSVVDPLRFIVALIVICGILQLCGMLTGPCNPPPGMWDNDLSMEEWEPIFKTWQSNPKLAESMYEEWKYYNP